MSRPLISDEEAETMALFSSLPVFFQKIEYAPGVLLRSTRAGLKKFEVVLCLLSTYLYKASCKIENATLGCHQNILHFISTFILPMAKPKPLKLSPGTVFHTYGKARARIKYLQLYHHQ